MNLLEFFRAKRTAAGQVPNSTAALPTVRVSVPDDEVDLVKAASNGIYSFVQPKLFPVELYDVLSNLSILNPDLRQAIGHAIQLGNTGHILKLKAGSDAQIEAMAQRIQDQAEIIYPHTAGVNGLINTLFGQVARTGALSNEWVPTKRLDGIDKVFMVPVGEIRWVARTDGMGYYPVQVPRTMFSMGKLQNAVKLNSRTYYYSGLETMENNPYAIPPMIAALEPIGTQKTMLKNIFKVLKKLGIMGLLSYKVTPPERKPGEPEAKYQTRCMAYLDTVSKQLKENFAEGIVVGFKGAYEFEVNGVTGDARGIKEIFNLNEEQLFSGIGADPSMHGRNGSTTETYASVVYSKMASQLCQYQDIVADNLEFGWGLDLTLAGMAGFIEVEFNTTQSLRNLQEAQTRMIEIANSEAMYQGGVIDQTEKARLLGYQTADQEEPRPDPALAQDKNLDQRQNTGGGSDNTAKSKTTKKKQPKESESDHTSAKFSYDRHFKKYYPVSDPIILNSLDILSLNSKQEDKNTGRYRRYLQRTPAQPD